MKALGHVAIVIGLLEDELDAHDGEVKPLIVGVMRPKKVLLLPLMQLKNLVP
jgi:hypothetical protein